MREGLQEVGCWQLGQTLTKEIMRFRANMLDWEPRRKDSEPFTCDMEVLGRNALAMRICCLFIRFVGQIVRNKRDIRRSRSVTLVLTSLSPLPLLCFTSFFHP